MKKIPNFLFFRLFSFFSEKIKIFRFLQFFFIFLTKKKFFSRKIVFDWTKGHLSTCTGVLNYLSTVPIFNYFFVVRKINLLMVVFYLTFLHFFMQFLLLLHHFFNLLLIIIIIIINNNKHLMVVVYVVLQIQEAIGEEMEGHLPYVTLMMIKVV